MQLVAYMAWQRCISVFIARNQKPKELVYVRTWLYKSFIASIHCVHGPLWSIC